MSEIRERLFTAGGSLRQFPKAADNKQPSCEPQPPVNAPPLARKLALVVHGRSGGLSRPEAAELLGASEADVTRVIAYACRRHWLRQSAGALWPGSRKPEPDAPKKIPVRERALLLARFLQEKGSWVPRKDAAEHLGMTLYGSLARVIAHAAGEG